MSVLIRKEYAKNGKTYNCSTNKYFTYALLLDDNKIYVGATDNIYQRLLTHFELADGSSKFVKANGPVKRILEITYDSPQGAENERTMEYMDIWGFQNVRGGYYSRLEINKPDALHFFERGKMSHNFMSRADIKMIENKIRKLMEIP